MSLPTKTLYQISGIFLGIIFLLGLGLYFLQSKILATRPSEHEHSPLVSANEQVEFESGELSGKLREKQMKELHPSIDRAMDEVLQESAR